MGKRWFLFLATLFGAFLAAAILVPLLCPFGSFTHLDGHPAFLDHQWSGIDGALYLLGDIICHQEMGRSIVLNGSQMPVCIRDTGLLLGFVIGMVFCSFRDEGLYDRRYGIIGVALLVPTLLDYIIGHSMSIDIPEIRFALAIVSGFGAALLVGYAINFYYGPGKAGSE